MPKLSKKKISAKTKEARRVVLNGLIANAGDRAKSRDQFIAEISPLLDTFNGTEKWWLWRELERCRCGSKL